eukprot:4678397-Pleurochrysis_carterae.AAC.2
MSRLTHSTSVVACAPTLFATVNQRRCSLRAQLAARLTGARAQDALTQCRQRLTIPKLVSKRSHSTARDGRLQNGPRSRTINKMAVGKSLTDVMSRPTATSSASSGCTRQSATAPSKRASAFKDARSRMRPSCWR